MRFVWVTDIPTPYRNHTFERMAALLPEYGIDFEVYFMAWTEPRRTWRFAPGDLKFPHRMFAGAHPNVRGVTLHFNPGLLARLATTRPDVVMIGGYSSPSHLLAPVMLNRRCLRILGCESNLQSVERTRGFVPWLKSKVVGRYDAYLVPGEPSLRLLRTLSPKAETGPVVVFPNLIDDVVFRAEVARVRPLREGIRRELGVPAGHQLWVLPARLAPEKGLSQFLDSMPSGLSVQVIVAGDGPERRSLSEKIKQRGLPVVLQGNVPQESMVRLYAAADVMVLPSLRDPSPLTVIEAAAAKLPLFVSDRIGNFADVLTPGENGWVYTADEPKANTAQMRLIAAASTADLQAMGEASGVLYAARFDTDTCVRRLAEQLVFLAQNHQGAP